MKRLILHVKEENNAQTVLALMRKELLMADGLISSVKFRPNGILLNGHRVRVTERVHTGDTLSVDISDRGENNAAPLDIPLPILWEDEFFAVIDKPAGICMYGSRTPNVAGALAKKWGKEVEFHPVNRLDVGTTGLMIAAKDGYTHDRLRRMLHTDGFIREYLAVAEGIVSPARGCIELPISAKPVAGTRRAVDPTGVPSRTDYEVISVSNGLTLLRIRLHTGRTHQIRVHFSAVGYPLAGDRMYGASDIALPRPALHSHHILLTHPVTGEWLDLCSALPSDIRALL